MLSRQTLEKHVRNASNTIYNRVRHLKYHLFVGLLLLFTYLMLHELTLERVIMYVASLIGIASAIRKNNEIKKLKKDRYADV